MPGCAALNCSNHSRNGWHLHKFPEDEARRALWGRNTGRNWEDYPNNLPSATLKLCEVHFNDAQYVDGNRQNRKLKRNAIPTIFVLNGVLTDLAVEVEDEHQNDDDEDMEAENHHHNDQDEHINMDQVDEEEDVDINPMRQEQPIDHDPQDNVLVYLLRDAEDRNIRLSNELERIKQERADFRRKWQRAQLENDNLRKNISKFLADDQIRRLETDGKDCSAWSEATIKKALQLRILTGINGYEYLRKNVGYPLPSYRTLCERLEKCPFPPGLDNNMFSYLGMKMREEEEISRNCVLVIDEMAMNKRVQYDRSLKCFLGHISPEIARDEEEKRVVASKVMIFLVRGLPLHWKQATAYVFTGSSMDKYKFWECIEIVVRKLEAEGLHVRGVIMDMGPCNLGVWNINDIDANIISTTNYCPHPARPDERFYFTADPPHILKNLWAALAKQNFTLPDALIEHHPEWRGNNQVSMAHLRKLVRLQQQRPERGLTLAPKLGSRHLNPSNFQVMNVEDAAIVFSHTTAAALRLCAQREDIPEIGVDALPTAWFCEQVNTWFDLMNLRRFGITGDLDGMQKIAQLMDFMDVIKNMKIGNSWKPIQRGILISTTTVIDLHRDLVVNGSFRYLMTSRLTTDSVENMNSQIRSNGDSHPGPVQVRQAIRLITVGQLLHVPKNSNYQVEDEAQYMINFLNTSKARPRVIEPIEDDDLIPPEYLTVLQEFGVYYVAGWAAKKASGRCYQCKEILIGDEPLADCVFNEWTSEVSRGGLIHPTGAAYKAIHTAESVFCALKESILLHQNVVNVLTHHAIENVDDDVREALVSDCGHDSLDLLIERFMKLRVHIFANDLTRQIDPAVAYEGRTVYMRTAVNAHDNRNNNQ